MIKHLKIYKLVSLVILLLASGCNNFLDVPSLTKVSSNVLLSNEKGIKMLLANLYSEIPMEDFNYRPDNGGFNQRTWGTVGLPCTYRTTMYTDESTVSQGNGLGPGGYDYFGSGTGNNDQNGNVNGFVANRDVNIFLKSIETAKANGVIDEAKYNRLASEAHFIRAYIYFGLAKRYGGVPIIDWLQDDDYTGDPSVLFKPRNTELDTWKFILTECDKAAENLPTPDKFISSDGNPLYRATKWTALALKSRAALYAASLAKFGGKVSFSGQAVTDKLVGMATSDAAFFYSQCIDASAQIINNSSHKLYLPNPANAQEAAKNYQDIFQKTPLSSEVIFARAYLDGSVVGSYQGHDWDNYYSPAQVPTGFHKWGRLCPLLDLVDLYEDYTDNGTGKSATIVTRTDGNENVYVTTNQPTAAQVTAIPFVKYSNPYEPFKDKDARLNGTVIVPGSTYRGVTIVMQGGLITPDGKLLIYQSASAVGLDGVTYNTYGPTTGYSGFFGIGSSDDANFSSTGFSVRKYLSESKAVSGREGSSSTSWIDFRLAEIYLNYAEAAVESGTGDQALAAKLINDLRHRAAHKDNIPLTAANVQKERRIELAFEGVRLWDMFRRREYHELFNGSFQKHALVQLLDLRETTPKYVFLRMNEFHQIQGGAQQFQTNNYYGNISGTNVNRLINNPGR